VLDAIHAVECPECRTGFESLLVTVIGKRSTGDEQSNSRRFSVRVIDPFDQEALVEFTRPSYHDIDLRPDDDLILSYLQERLVVVQNLTIRRYYRLIPLQKKKKRQKRSRTWTAIAILSALPLLFLATVLALQFSPLPNPIKLFATEPPSNAPPAVETLSPVPKEGRLWCPGCATEGLKIILWEKGSAETSGVMGEGKHGDEVELLSREHNPSENRTYYLVRIKALHAQGWVPETLIRLEPLDDSAAITEDGRAAPTESPVRFYVVQAGDTLGTIAEKYGTTVQRLIDLNDIQHANLIEVGEALIVDVPANWTPSPAQP
jgi:LysM repeat protein